jgi:hypothetical protein
MSEFFERLQNQLRNTKEALGVDLANPHGVSIHEKLYPAHNKILYLVGGKDTSMGDNRVGGDYGLRVPLENGTHAELTGAVIGNWKENKEKGISHDNTAFHNAYARHNEPAIRLFNGKREYIHVPYNDTDPNSDTHHSVEWQNNTGTHPDLSVDDLHNTLKKWSQKPYKGSYHIDTGSEVHKTDLSAEELQEHRQQFSHSPHWNEGKGPVRPNLLTVVPLFKENNKNYHVYDVNTEQLHDTGIATPWGND